MNLKQIVQASLIAAVVAMVAFAILFYTIILPGMQSIAPQASQALGGSVPGGPTGSGGGTRFTNIPLNSNVVVTTSSTLVAATSTARQYLTIVNDSANTVYISEGQAAVGSNGIRLNASGGSYEINALNLYTGAIYAIASSTSILDVIVNQ